MGIIEWLILSLGAFGAVHGSKCMPETAVCSPYWVQMEPHKNLMESEEELNSWCRKQSMFFRCLEDVLLSIYGNYSRLPINMLVSKMFSEDLCLKESTNRKRYLDNAPCINQLDFEHCTLPEYLEIVTPDGSVPPTKCSLEEKTFSCIAATMVMRCGFDAGRVYRYLLKVTKYGEEVCGQESSGASCEEATDSELSEIYYGLVHRFGIIPEQVTEAASLDGEDSMFLSEAMENVSDDMEASSEGDVSSARSASDYNEVIRNKDEFRKKPIITEPFKGLLFYNYSNEEFEFYWRQPGSFPISRVTCDHLINSDMKGVMFECILYYGYEEPECVKLTEEEEKITPELIRDIDFTIPEDSTLHISKSPDWTADLRDYRRHRMSWEFFFNAKIVSEEDDIRWVNKHLEVEYPNSEVCAKELRFYDVINNHYIDWWQCPSFFSDELRIEILNFFFQNRSRDTDFFFLTAVNGNGTDGDKNGNWITYIHLFEPLFHGFEKVVCDRVNECHPRGRGVFKCSLERRGIEGCDSCCVQFPYYAKLCPTKQGTESKDKRDLTELFNSSEEGSGALEEESPTEVASFIVNDEQTESPDESTFFVTGVADDRGDIIAVDISELPDSDTDYSSDASRMFLRRNSDYSTTDSFVAQPEDTDSISEEETLYDDLSELELKLHKNLFVLKAVPSIADIKAVYEIIESKDQSK